MRCIFDPGSGIDFFWIPDPKPIILIAYDLVLLLKRFSLRIKSKIICNFMIFVATKKKGQKKFLPLVVLLLDPGSGMDKNQDPG